MNDIADRIINQLKAVPEAPGLEKPEKFAEEMAAFVLRPHVTWQSIARRLVLAAAISAVLVFAGNVFSRPELDCTSPASSVFLNKEQAHTYSSISETLKLFDYYKSFEK